MGPLEPFRSDVGASWSPLEPSWMGPSWSSASMSEPSWALLGHTGACGSLRSLQGLVGAGMQIHPWLHGGVYRALLSRPLNEPDQSLAPTKIIVYGDSALLLQCCLVRLQGVIGNFACNRALQNSLRHCVSERLPRGFLKGSFFNCELSNHSFLQGTSRSVLGAPPPVNSECRAAGVSRVSLPRKTL